MYINHRSDVAGQGSGDLRSEPKFSARDSRFAYVSFFCGTLQRKEQIFIRNMSTHATAAGSARANVDYDVLAQSPRVSSVYQSRLNVE